MSLGTPAPARRLAFGRGGGWGGRLPSWAAGRAGVVSRSAALLWMLAALLAPWAPLSACAGPAAQVDRGPVEGRPCAEDAQCAPPAFVCKAARCLPKRSRVGEPCVRDGACAAGLVCVLGQCSAGPADAALCARMCRHAALVSTGGLMPGNYAAFAEACIQRCTGRVPREHAACVLQAPTPEQVRACP